MWIVTAVKQRLTQVSPLFPAVLIGWSGPWTMYSCDCSSVCIVTGSKHSLTRFRRTSDGEVIPGPEHGFDIVGGYFSADLKSSLSLIH